MLQFGIDTLCFLNYIQPSNWVAISFSFAQSCLTWRIHYHCVQNLDIELYRVSEESG